MVKSNKQTAPRKPIKARGALPTPRMAPARVTKVWYKRRGNQLIGVALILVLTVIGITTALNIRESSRTRARDVKAIRQFDRKVQLLQTAGSTVFQSVNQAPTDFLAGTMPAEEYRVQAERWVEEFRKLNSGLRSGPLGSPLDALEEARGLYVQGTVIYVDAAKSLALASRFSATPDREEAIKQGRNLLTHGSAVLSMGERQMQKLKDRFGLNQNQETGTPPQQIPVQLPEEEAAPAAQPPASAPANQPPPSVGPVGSPGPNPGG
jgi:hypothetical protein